MARLGPEVRKARRRLGLSQTGYSKKTGLSQQVLSNLEHEQRNDPRLSTVIALVFRGGMELTVRGLRAAREPDKAA